MNCKECGKPISPNDEKTYKGRCSVCDKIRNDFAAAALKGIIIGTLTLLGSPKGAITESPEGGFTEEHFAREAFEQADEMMKARRK
jgi:hypothetical protein